MCAVLHFIFILYTITLTQENNEFHLNNVTVNKISDNLITILNSAKENPKLKELRQKLGVVNQYVVDNDAVAIVLNNVTSQTELNATNFYDALKNNDHFKNEAGNDSRSLYLKLKEKMTRDDILTIIAERGKEEKMVKSARRMIENPLPEKVEEEQMNNVVDGLIAQLPKDNHRAKVNESIYWDPQAELEDLKEHHASKLSGRRLYKGERTSIRFYPFMASIHVMGRFWCGGSLYWHDLVLTSASCLQLMHNNRFFRENPRAIQVRFGSNHSRIGGEVMDVLEVYFHPSYNSRTLRDNLAIIRLRRHLAFRRRRIPRIIDIPHTSNGIPSTSDIQVLGWGVTKSSQKMQYEPIFLQKKTLPVYPNQLCKDVYGEKFISNKMFCAGTLTTGEGACDHDAGGPAILSGKLVGIISFGPAICGFPDAPTVFTLVGAYSDWIEMVNESMPNYYRAKSRTTTTRKSSLSEYFATWNTVSNHLETIYPAVKKSHLINNLIITPPPETMTTTTTTTTQETTTVSLGRMRIPEYDSE